MKVYIVGAGPGHCQYLTQAATEAIQQAELVIAPKRLAQQLGTLNKNTVCKNFGDTMQAVLAARASFKKIAVLVSGDCGFFSAGKQIVADLQAVEGLEVESLCGMSSMQYLFAKLGQNYEGATVLSVHGREGCIVPAVCYNPLVFALSGGNTKAHDLVKNLVRAGLDDVWVTVGENLGAANEKIVSGVAYNLQKEQFGDLACVLVRNENFVNCYGHIADEEFIRGQVPMTKQAVRTLAIGALNIQPKDTVWDIGAGTGSVAIEMARRANRAFVYAVEKNAIALELAHKNRKQFGAYNMVLVSTTAPGGLEDLPAPDKVFIGGSGPALGEVVTVIKQKNAQASIVITAISLEKLHDAVQSFSASGYEHTIMCINAAFSSKAGTYTMMRAENPVYIIIGTPHAH